MSEVKTVSSGHYLFREGDVPDAMYVVKSGQFAVIKTKDTAEIKLAEIGPGSLVGEMAFFDAKPRSAGVRALKDSEVISLPYKSLHAQFQSFPEWTKALVRTVNDHLRNANSRIKALESVQSLEVFSHHTILQLLSILNLIGSKYGQKSKEGLEIPGEILRNYTIQVFQLPTSKMQKLIQLLIQKGIATGDLEAANSSPTLFKPDELFDFTDWYRNWLFNPKLPHQGLSGTEANPVFAQLVDTLRAEV
jgi:CRP-like cAMP-binding protein